MKQAGKSSTRRHRFFEVTRLLTGAALVLSLLIGVSFAEGPQTAANDPVVNEVMRDRQNYQRQMQQMNQANPLSGKFDAQAFQKMAESNERLGQLVRHPIIRKLIRLLSDDRLIQQVEKFSQDPDRMLVVYAEIGWLLIFVLLKAWILSKIDQERWFLKLILSFSSYFVFIGVLPTLPFFVFGKEYLDMAKYVWSVLWAP